MPRVSLFCVCLRLMCTWAQASENSDKAVLFTNVSVFDGVDDQLMLNQRVLVRGNLIEAVGPNVTSDGARVIVVAAAR